MFPLPAPGCQRVCPMNFPLPVQLLYYWATEKITEKFLIELFSSNKLVLVAVINNVLSNSTEVNAEFESQLCGFLTLNPAKDCRDVSLYLVFTICTKIGRFKCLTTIKPVTCQKNLTLRQLYNPSAYSLASKLFNNNKVSSKWGSFGKLNAQILNKRQDLHTNLWLNLNATTPKFNVNVNISMAHQQYFINSHFFFQCSTFRHEWRQYICWLVAHK